MCFMSDVISVLKAWKVQEKLVRVWTPFVFGLNFKCVQCLHVKVSSVYWGKKVGCRRGSGCLAEKWKVSVKENEYIEEAPFEEKGAVGQ